MKEEEFYDPLAETYHLIFADWNEAIERQGRILSALLDQPDEVGRILDCACGIGTQTFGLASLGYNVEGSDISAMEIKRAQKETQLRALDIEFRVDDMKSLSTATDGAYGAVIALDNALPHLDSDAEILEALKAMLEKLRTGGTVLVSVRDYASLLDKKPAATPPVFYQDGDCRRIVHQIWDWRDDRRYTVHLFITRQQKISGAKSWSTQHHVGYYRAVTADEIAKLMTDAGFIRVKVLDQTKTGFYQPIISGCKE